MTLHRINHMHDWYSSMCIVCVNGREIEVDTMAAKASKPSA